MEFRQQHLHRSILILGSSTNLYYSLLQKQFIRRVTKSCFGGCSLLRGIVSTVELQMRHRCLSGTRGHYTNDTNAKQQIRLYLIKQERQEKYQTQTGKLNREELPFNTLYFLFSGKTFSTHRHWISLMRFEKSFSFTFFPLNTFCFLLLLSF